MREKPEARGVQITACLLMGVGTRSGEVTGAGEQRAGERYAPRQSGYFKFLMADRGGSLLKSSV